MPGEQLDAAVAVLTQAAALALLLAAVAGAVRGLSSTRQPPRFAIAPRELDRIARRYGVWAARRAEAGCPQGDVACVEREARRLFETVRRRRAI